jgi:uncharacterized membrane protein YkoI
MYCYHDINVYIKGQLILESMNHGTKNTFVIIAATALAIGILVTVINSEAFAQVNSTSSNTSSAAPRATNQKNVVNPINFTGTIPLHSTINKAVSSQVKIPLTEAVSTAQKAVGSNSSATLAFLRALNGYIVYDIHVTNNSNNTSYAIIIDPGNGQVLYHQALTPFSSAGHPFMFGKGGAGAFYGGHRGGFGS